MDKDEKTGQFLAGNKYGRGRKGIRNKFHADFITDLHDHYHMTGAAIAAGGLTRGQAAIEIVYRESPRDYLKVIVSVFPKEFTHKLARPEEELSDEELAEVIDKYRRDAGAIGSGENSARDRKQIEILPPLREAKRVPRSGPKSP